MRNSKKIGLLAVIVGAALMAPRETYSLLNCMVESRIETKNNPSKESTQNTDNVEKVGLIRTCKSKIIQSCKSFWKWLY